MGYFSQFLLLSKLSVIIVFAFSILQFSSLTCECDTSKLYIANGPELRSELFILRKKYFLKYCIFLSVKKYNEKNKKSKIFFLNQTTMKVMIQPSTHAKMKRLQLHPLHTTDHGATSPTLSYYPL